MALLGLTVNSIPVPRGVAMMHSPEKWLSGGGLLAGVPALEIRDICGPLTVNNECSVDFGTVESSYDTDRFGPRLRLTATKADALTVTVTDAWDEQVKGTVMARVVPLSPKPSSAHGEWLGFMLVLDITSEWVVDTDQLRKCLEVGLWGCSDEDAPEREQLRVYREHLGVTFSPPYKLPNKRGSK